jgi:hypothetical protein
MEIRPRDKKSYRLSRLPSGIEWKHWRDPAVKPKDWVKTDDDVVLYVTGVNETAGSDGMIRLLVRTVLGIYDQMRSSPLMWSDRYTRFVEDNTVSKMGRHRIDRAPTARERNWVKMVVAGMSPMRAASLVWPETDEKGLKGRLKAFGRNERLVRYMGDLLKAALAEQGINEDFVALQLKRLATEADKSSVELEAAKLMLELLGYGKVKETKTGTFEADFFVDPGRVNEIPSRWNEPAQITEGESEPVQVGVAEAVLETVKVSQ